MSDQVTVKVLLKVEGWFSATPYEPGDMLHPALTFTTGFPACGQVETVAGIVRDQLNMPEPQADWSVNYRRQRHNRTLAVGDVVVGVPRHRPPSTPHNSAAGYVLQRSGKASRQNC